MIYKDSSSTSAKQKMADKFIVEQKSTAGGIATGVTLGLDDDVHMSTEQGASVVSNNEKDEEDGSVIEFIEGLPGYAVSAGHGINAAITGDADDLQRARRACASATKSTLVAGGAIVGGLVAGPLGAAGGAALGSAGGQCSEKGINHAIDEGFQTSGGTFHNFDGIDFVGEMVIDATIGGVCAGVGDTVGKPLARSAVGPSLKEVGGGGVKRYVAKRATEAVVKKPVGIAIGVGGHTIKEELTS